MSRPRKGIDGRTVFSFSANGELAKALHTYKAANPGGFSSFVCSCVEDKTATRNREIILLYLQAVNLQISAAYSEQTVIDKKIISLNEEKTRLEASLKEIEEKEEKFSEQRNELIKRAIRSKWLDNYWCFEGFATGPAGVELIGECGFDGAKEAFDWLKANIKMLEK